MYRDLNDYEILYLVCENNDLGYEVLLEKYRPLISKLICKYRNLAKKIGYEYEDLYQICSITLYSAIKGYNGDINNNLFYTYLLRCLENSLINIIRINGSNKKRVLNESISYDNYIPNSSLTYADIFPDNKELKNDYFIYYDLYLDYRNSFEFDISCIFDLKMEGYKNHEISILLGLSYNEVICGIKKIHSKVC